MLWRIELIWFPTGPETKSSSRIQVFNIHEKLIELGYNSIIGYHPKKTIWHLPINKKIIEAMELCSDDLVIIQKFKKKSTQKLIEQLKKTPAKVGYIDCDEPIAEQIAKLVDFVIVPSTYLQKRYERLGVTCHYIEDCPEKFNSTPNQSGTDSPLKCVWFGNHSKSKWKEVVHFQQLLKRNKNHNWSFETISNTRLATHRWNSDSFNKLTQYDLVVIPVPHMTMDYKVKSANRLLQSMALGVPVIASPVPSYLGIIKEHELSNIICQDDEDWHQKLEYYSIQENRKLASKKNIEIARNYKLDQVIEDWIKVFQLTKTKRKPLSDRCQNLILKKAKWRGSEIVIRLK